ncbi:MAG: Benzoyl-CoA oxygenase component A [Rhodocyclaceae bacterium]|nr:MAG: Benzoyl-CoA oxygenase component A [Rhodocyclaceae bacterium]
MTIMRQHLIDPEICIRCNTCEETCPVDAISHDSLPAQAVLDESPKVGAGDTAVSLPDDVERIAAASMDSTGNHYGRSSCNRAATT